MKIVINTTPGGFGLSQKAYKELDLERDDYGFAYKDFSMRSNEDLVRVVEKLGSEASGFLANLKVVEIPDDIEWEIEAYDGLEWVAEKHRTWY